MEGGVKQQMIESIVVAKKYCVNKKIIVVMEGGVKQQIMNI